MILSRLGIQERGWLLGIVFVVLIVAAIEPFQIPGAPPAGPENDIFRWFLQIPAFFAAIGLMMLRPRWAARLMNSPAKWLGAFAIWQLVVASFGLKPLASTVLSLGFTAYIGLGVVIVARGGWERARGYLEFTLGFIAISSLLLFLTGSGGGLRLNGIMSHPNHLGGAMGIALVVFLDKFLKGANWALALFFLSGGSALSDRLADRYGWRCTRTARTPLRIPPTRHGAIGGRVAVDCRHFGYPNLTSR